MAAFPFAVGIAASIRVGHLLGAANARGAQTTAKLTFGLILLFMATLAALKVLFRDYLGMIFTRDERVISTVAGLAVVAAIFQISDGTQAKMRLVAIGRPVSCDVWLRQAAIAGVMPCLLMP